MVVNQILSVMVQPVVHSWKRVERPPSWFHRLISKPDGKKINFCGAIIGGYRFPPRLNAKGEGAAVHAHLTPLSANVRSGAGLFALSVAALLHLASLVLPIGFSEDVLVRGSFIGRYYFYATRYGEAAACCDGCVMGV